MTNTFVAGQTVTFTTTGALPTGVTAGQQYFVIATGLSGSVFRFSATLGGSAVVSTGTQSGVHTATAGFMSSEALVLNQSAWEVKSAISIWAHRSRHIER